MSKAAVLVLPMTVEELRALVREELAAVCAPAEAWGKLPSAGPSQGQAEESGQAKKRGPEPAYQAAGWISTKACGLPPTVRRRLTREGKLPTSKIGRQLMVRRADVEKFVASQVKTDEPGDEFTRALAKGRR